MAAKETVIGKFVNQILFKVDKSSVDDAKSAISEVKGFAAKALGAIGIGFSFTKLASLAEEFGSINDTIRGATREMGDQADLSKINVAVGQKLKPGDLIGVEGSTGHSTGSHLHWEIRINDISTGYVSVHQYAGIPNVAGSTAYTSNWAAELFGPSNLKKSTSGFPQRLYNSVLQGALGIDKDGIFGANTEKTVKEFQSAHGLTADGIAGAKTKAALAKQL